MACFFFFFFFPTPANKGVFSCGSAGKEYAGNVGDLGLIPGLGRSPGEGKGYPLQYSGLENPMDCIVHGVTKSWTRLKDSLHFRANKERIQSCIFKVMFLLLLFWASLVTE